MRLQLLVIAIAALVVAAPALAGDGKGHTHGHGKGKGKGGQRRVFCPHCGDACYPTVTKAKETKHCWNVESKTICIPKVRFPWDPCVKGKGGGKDGCPPPKCGRTKEVNVLIKHEYECSTCKYSWDPDSFKNGKGNDKYKDGPAPAAEQPEVRQPPMIEARRPPVQFEPSAQTSSETSRLPKRSYTEVLTGFFK